MALINFDQLRLRFHHRRGKSMRWKMVRRGATATAAAAAALALTGGTASAYDAYFASLSRGGEVVSRAAFIYNGDNLRVCDTGADGHSAVARLIVQGYDQPFHAWAKYGKGSCYTRYLNFPEWREMIVYACVGESGSGDIIDCGPGRQGTT